MPTSYVNGFSLQQRPELEEAALVAQVGGGEGLGPQRLHLGREARQPAHLPQAAPEGRQEPGFKDMVYLYQVYILTVLAAINNVL